MFHFRGWGCVSLTLMLSNSVQAMPQNAASPNAIHATEAKAPALVVPTAPELPVRRVVLYKTGVGYFEHLGGVEGDQNVRIDFTSGQLNDVLESLTILDLKGGRIAGVSYNSEAPLSQRLGGLRLPLEETTDASRSALTQRYTQQLADQETRLETLERESVDLRDKRDKAQGELDRMIETLSLQATM